MSELIIPHLFEILVLCTNGMVTYIVWKLKKKDIHKENANKALALLLRRELSDMYGNLKEKKTITSSEYKDFDEVYTVYHGLGGNGVGTHMYEKIKEKEING